MEQTLTPLVMCAGFGLSPNGRLIDPILGPQHCGLDPQGLISLKNNSRKGHSEEKVDSNLGSKQRRSECVVWNRHEQLIAF